MSQKTTLNLRIDTTLKQRFQQRLKTTGENATDVITRAIETYCHYSNDEESNDTLADSNDVVITKIKTLESRLKWLEKYLSDLQSHTFHNKSVLINKLDCDFLEGVSCSFIKPNNPPAPVCEIRGLANFYGCCTDTLNKQIRIQTNGKVGDKFDYRGTTWEITATHPRTFRQV